jgi:predicted RNA-binding protein with PIN domain
MPRWLVDGMNLIGSRPTGWWRDREGAVRALIERLRAYVDRTGDEVAVVFDARPGDVEPGSDGGLTVGFATRRGPNAADDEIVRLVDEDPDPGSLRVVTSDRELAERVTTLGAPVESAGAFLHRLEKAEGTDP